MYQVVGISLGLRQLTPDDITDEMMAWFSDDGLMKYYTNSKNQITKESLSEAIVQGKHVGNNFTYGIFHIASFKCIGTIRLGPINLPHKISDLVVLIGDREYHGKGLAVEAIALGNKVAFEIHGLRKLFGGMYASNIASIKAYLRAGWVAEGILKGHYLNKSKAEDRIEVGCFNPDFFTEKEMAEAQLLSLDSIIEKYQSM
ncbi:MAG: GNAT family N-acetyltransferase [Flavobacteriales bacterium]